MTWSILARDADGVLGAAIASRFFAVGALCLHARAGVGILSTQALMNPLYGRAGLDALESGVATDAAIAGLTDADEGRDLRQVHVVPARGAPAAFTGAQCVEWCGHRTFDTFSVAGNMLAGPEVVDATADAFAAARGTLAERLIAAMQAGDAAGGDKRGKQGAALRIQADQDYPQLDLRVDDHAEPLAELERLYRRSLERFQPFVACLATREHPHGTLDRGAIEAHVRAHAEAHGLGPPTPPGQ